MLAALIAAVVYLLGGYVVLALIAHKEPGAYTEWELIGWSLAWPLWVPLALALYLVELAIRKKPAAHQPAKEQ